MADITVDRVLAVLAEIKRRGRAPQTCNGYLASMKSFATWLLLDKRMEHNPLLAVRGMNTKVDRRHDRRALTADELARLIRAAAEGGDVEGLTGEQRAWLYRLAGYTGLRSAELASLTPASFRLDAATPTVRVAAAYSKRRRDDVVPLHPSLVEPLRDWLAGKPADEQLWPGKWSKLRRGARMMRHDLFAAGIEYRDSDGRYADLHSLRATFITLLARSGVHPSVAQRLARHSTIRLTMDIYTKTTPEEAAQGVAALPPLPPA
jgi:integrase